MARILVIEDESDIQQVLEYNLRQKGHKVFIATVVAQGCCLGAAVVDTADEAGLARGYGEFKREAQNAEPGYSPETVNADGWAATRLAHRSGICRPRSTLRTPG